MIVSAHPLAEQELVDGAVYYSTQGTPELAADFIGEFDRSINILREHPQLGAVWRRKFRRLPMRRFPYNIIYYLSGDILRVIALAHQRRILGYWRRRV